jgi:pimeloyl-ACP methyl ester carboxylesterase
MGIPRWLILCMCVGACHTEPHHRGVISTWRDPSPHTSQTVRIAPGAAVEVLDWGGRGRPLMFLAGLGNTPHVYDDFAPALTDHFHVFGITRRGFGRSIGLPDTNVVTLVGDLRAVLDSLRLSRVILVGHSIAGEELTGFGATYPDRCDALVYLDAASDRSGQDTTLARELERLNRPAVYRPPMRSADSSSLAAVEAYYARNAVRGLPEAEVRALTRFDSAGRYAGRIGYDSLGSRRIGQLLASLQPPAYHRLRCPSLAIYPVPDSPAAYFPWYHTLDSAGRRDAANYFRALAPGLRDDIDQYRRNAPLSHVAEIHNASHWVFLSNRDETLRALRTFLATAGS